jgi:hypothetical protein
MEQAKKEIIEMCEKEIGRGEIFMGFYKKQELKEKNKEEKAKIGLKIKQIEDSVKINSEILDYVKSL